MLLTEVYIFTGGGIWDSGWFTNFLFTVAAIVCGAWSSASRKITTENGEELQACHLACHILYVFSHNVTYLSEIWMIWLFKTFLYKWADNLMLLASEANTGSHFKRGVLSDSAQLHVYWLLRSSLTQYQVFCSGYEFNAADHNPFIND